MASLFFICPKTRHKASTGIETDAKSLQAAWTVAVPLAEPRRRRPLVVGAFLTAAWIALLRYGLSLFFVSPVIPWALIVITLSWSLVLERQLGAAAYKSAYPS